VLARLAWSLVVLAGVLVAVDVVVSAQAVSLTSEVAIAVHGFPFVHGAAVGCTLMGAAIVSHYERHPIGWLLSAVGILTAVSLLTEGYAYWVQESDGPGSATLASVSAWVAQLCGGQVVVTLIALMYLVAPDGHLLSPRWRWAAYVPATGALLCLAAILTVDPTEFDLVGADARFGAVRVAMLSVGFLLITVGVLLGLASMVRRLALSAGEERQQLRPIALAAALAAVGLAFLFVGQALHDGMPTWVSGVPLAVAFFLMPILFAVAVLRYRLYDLDVIINRAVVVAAAAGFAAVGYTVLVVLAGRQVEGRTGALWLSLLATALVALAFQPLRRGVVRLANRAAYGERAQPYEALADFSRRLSEAPDPDALLPAVAEAAGRAVSGRGAQARLEVPGSEPVTGTWGWWAQPGDSAHVVPVRSGDRQLGEIAVALPRGRHLRPSDLRLLEALADQTAVAFRNTSLAGSLADRVVELASTTAQLAASRRRLVAADVAGRRSLEAAIARDVLPFMGDLSAEIRRARTAVAAGEPADLERLVDGTNEALEALRELTRGVYPTQLARAGLEPVLRSLVARSAVVGSFSADGVAGRRFPLPVERAVWSCCVEVVRVAGPDPVTLELEAAPEALVVRVRGPLGDLDPDVVTDRVAVVDGALRLGDDLLELTVPVPETAVTAQS
jgi:hypothetical protein